MHTEVVWPASRIAKFLDSCQSSEGLSWAGQDETASGIVCRGYVSGKSFSLPEAKLHLPSQTTHWHKTSLDVDIILS